MATMTQRRQTSFRLPSYMVNDLKDEARKQNRSMNSIVVSFLHDLLYQEPNKETLEAMAECESGVELKKVDTSSLDAFIQSLEE